MFISLKTPLPFMAIDDTDRSQIPGADSASQRTAVSCFRGGFLRPIKTLSPQNVFRRDFFRFRFGRPSNSHGPGPITAANKYGSVTCFGGRTGGGVVK